MKEKTDWKKGPGPSRSGPAPQRPKWVKVMLPEREAARRPQHSGVWGHGIEIARSDRSVLVWIPKLTPKDKNEESLLPSSFSSTSFVEATPNLVIEDT